MTQWRVVATVFFVSLFSTSTFARGGGNILRGGVGFLFPDHNSFVNPGQFAATNGMAVEALYSTSNVPGAVQGARPSFVYGNGAFGLGANWTRSGANLSTGTDSIGAGLGFALVKGRATVGLGYDRQLGAGAGNGDINVTLTFNPANRRGAAFGLGYKTTLGSGVNGLTAGLGFAFGTGSNFEVDATWANINTLGTFDGSAVFTTAKRFFYMGGGYVMNKAATMTHGLTGRFGFVLGTSIDLSAMATKYFVSGSNSFAYGGSLRASF